MKRSYKLIKTGKINVPCEFKEAYKKIDEKASSSLKEIPIQTNHKKEKLNNFLNKLLTKFFCLNKEVYINGSKNCVDEFNFYSDKKL